jgi:two-component system, NarL family, response regulator DevR
MDVLLVEDHTVFREALGFLLAREPQTCVVGQAGSIAEARRVLKGLRTLDAALLDLGLPDGDGTDLMSVIRADFPNCAMLVLTASAEWRDQVHAIQAGAVGVLHKSAPLEDILRDLRRVAAGENLLTPAQLLDLLQRLDPHHLVERVHLTEREQEVLQALADGLSDKEIAVRLTLSAETVHKHMGNILGKIGVGSRVQALLYAVRNGLVAIH